jgi:hypothetical protein
MSQRVATLCFVLVCLPLIAVAQKPVAIKIDFDPVAKVKAHLQENTNDPKKLSFVKFGEPVPANSLEVFRDEMYEDDFRIAPETWKPIPNAIAAVQLKYRAANALGAVVISEEVFFLDKSGAVVDARKTQNVRTVGKRTEPETDPFLESFNNQFSGKKKGK